MNLRMRISMLFVLFFLLPAFAADDPLIGTWKLNLVKSKFDPGPPPKSSINKFEPFGANGVKRTQDEVDAKGEASHIEVNYTFDGKEYPATHYPAFHTMLNRRIDTYTTERIVKKAGKLLNTTRRVVSKDGKTLTITNRGADAQGRLFSEVNVYDRQ